MTLLSDLKILEEIENGNILIEPFFRECLGSNSYDVHLKDVVGLYEEPVLDAKKENKINLFKIPKEGMVLQPRKFYLCSTIEYTETRNFVPFLEGKSSTGRLGISVHETAGKGDAGFRGHWTLEVSVNLPVRVYAGIPIGQLIYFDLNGKVLISYDKKRTAKYSYQGSEPVGSKMWKNFGRDPLWTKN